MFFVLLESFFHSIPFLASRRDRSSDWIFQFNVAANANAPILGSRVKLIARDGALELSKALWQARSCLAGWTASRVNTREEWRRLQRVYTDATRARA